ncbi:MAG: preprotein translocase subunit SecE [candidate division Zixibacteria bacterium]|nr:preprotein translocase subunit SecE [candidate division Zixibacteria bacterium]
MQKIISFLKEVRTELTKVTWPTRGEIVGSTMVTIIVSIILSVFIGIVDFVLNQGIKAIF